MRSVFLSLNTTPVSLAVLWSCIALLVQWLYLWDVPRFTDETYEILRGLAIYAEGFRPLLNNDPYKGAFFNYLLAGGFLVGGPNPYLPRLIVALFYSATVALISIWGYQIGGTRMSVLAAVILTFNPITMLGSYHEGISNSITPFFLQPRYSLYSWRFEVDLFG